MISKKSVMGVLGVATAAVIGIGGLTMYSNAAMSVTSYIVDRGEIVQTLELNGNVEAEDSQSCYAVIDGRIAKIYVKEGDVVKKGDLLVSFDTEKIDDMITLAGYSAAADLESYNSAMQADQRVAGLYSESKRNLAVLDTQINDYQAAIAQLESDIAYKKAELVDHGAALQISLIEWSDKPDSEEYEELQKQIATNTAELQSNYELIEMQKELSDLSQHLAACKEYKAEMTSQKASTFTATMTQADKDKLEAVKAASEFETGMKIAELESAKEGIRAEYDGVVTAISVTEDAYVAKGTPLMTIDSTETVMVRLNVNKYDIVNMHSEQPANVAIKGKDYSGKVERISHMTGKNDIGVDVDIKLDDPDEDLILGLEAKAKIDTAKVENVIRIPLDALMSDATGDYVFVSKDKKAVKKYVETGMRNDDMIEVLSGISEGECVIWNDTQELTDGVNVKVD